MRAVEEAERNALITALAPNLTIEALVVNLRLSNSILGTIPHGEIELKEIIEEGLVEPIQSEVSRKESKYRVQIKAGVLQKNDPPDSSFNLDASMNQSVFKDGDELEIHIRSTRDCHLLIYNILEGNKVIRLLPNYLSGTSSISADVNYTFPGDQERKKGLKLRVHLPENAKTTTEYIYIIALSGLFQLESVNAQEGIFGVFDGDTAFMRDLIGAVIRIPLKNRAETLLQYEIRKTKKGV